LSNLSSPEDRDIDSNDVDFLIEEGRVCLSTSSSNPTKKSSGNDLCCCSHLEDDIFDFDFVFLVVEPPSLVALLRSQDERFGGRMRLSRDVAEETDVQEDDRAMNRATDGRTDEHGLSSFDSQALRFVPILSGEDVVK